MLENIKEVLLTSQWKPNFLPGHSAWIEHGSFAFSLVALLRPTQLVELGCFSGFSYFCFCQTIRALNFPCKAFAVDTWKGDEHGGFYDEGVYESVSRENTKYSAFSNLLRMQFDEAVKSFEAGSIDLLHIDGLHTYEAVKHDFQTWLPKLSKNAVVLFHDTNVRQDDFGVWKFFGEVRKRYPSFEFFHGHGLGLIFLGVVPTRLKWLSECTASQAVEIREHFSSLGTASAIEMRLRLESYQNRIELDTLRHSIAGLENSHEQERDVVERKRRLAVASGLRRRAKAKITKAYEYQRHVASKVEREAALAAERKEIVHALYRQFKRHGLAPTKNQSSWWRWRAEDRQNAEFSILEQSPLFDSSWYWEKYPDVKSAGANPIQHYLEHGAAEGRDPGPLFSTEGYLSANPDVRAAGLNPVVHFETHGWEENRELACDRSAVTRVDHSHPLKLRMAGFAIILTTKHCVFVAKLIEEALLEIGMTSKIITGEPPGGYEDLPHFVISAQSFNRLPRRYVAFQMEQTVSSRWFNTPYLELLHSAFAVLDYSTLNISKLVELGLTERRLFYVPLGASAEEGDVAEAKSEPEFEVAFYGDINCIRRKEILQALAAEFKVDIISEVYGDELRQRLDNAKLVVNLHYYENALLETTRIFECLSQGRQIVSESGSDHREHSCLEGLVDFVETGDVQGLISAIRFRLANLRVPDRKAMRCTTENFRFHLYRFLLWADEISFSEFYSLTSHNCNLGRELICLSLPEYAKRRSEAEKELPKETFFFSGIRHVLGWVGCGMSYKYLLMRAKELALPTVTICEDDVELPKDWELQYNKAVKYLAQRNRTWDLFSGLIADINISTKVLAVENVTGSTYVMIDKMTSTVFNIYNSNFYNAVLSWDEKNHDATKNTIDRHIEKMAGLQVVVKLPYMVGHKEDVHSILWGFKNDTYRKMIQESQSKLESLVRRWMLQKAR